MAPSFVAAGTVAGGTAAITPALPTGIVQDDILVTIAECEGVTAPGAFTLPTGWAHVTGSPVQEGTNTRLWVIWRRYVAGDTAPSLGDAGDHGIGRMIAIRGCPLSGNPWHVVASATSATSSTTVSSPGVATTKADCLMVEIISTGADVTPAGTAQITSLTNAALTSITERVDNNDPAGNGGVIGCYTAVKATAGATGASAWTLATAATKAMMTIAFAVAPPRYDSYNPSVPSFVPVAHAATW